MLQFGPTAILERQHSASADQTIVFLRHAEKPAAGLGQLTCQGLNRSLALPTILISRYGTPTYVYSETSIRDRYREALAMAA